MNSVAPSGDLLALAAHQACRYAECRGGSLEAERREAALVFKAQPTEKPLLRRSNPARLASLGPRWELIRRVYEVVPLGTARESRPTPRGGPTESVALRRLQNVPLR